MDTPPKIALKTFFSLGMLAISMTAMLLSNKESSVAALLVEHTYQVLNLSKHIQTTSIEHKSLITQYLSTHDADTLKKMQRARKEIVDDLSRLGQLTVGHPVQQQLKPIGKTFDDVITESESQLPSRGGLIMMGPTISIVATGQIDSLNTALIARLTAFDNTLQALSRQQQKTASRKVMVAETIMLFSLLAGVGILLLTLRELRREVGLREIAEERWKFALEGAGEGVWDWNLVTNKTFYSRRWKEILGLDEEEIGDEPEEWEAHIHPDDKAGVSTSIRDYFDGKTQQYTSEYRIICKDGSFRWVRERGQVATHNADDKPLRMIGTLVDITERKQMENALFENEQRLRYMLETSPVAVRIARAGGHAVIFANKRYSELINSHASQLLGQDPRTYYANPQDYDDILARLANHEQIFDKLVELMIPGEGTKWALASYLMIQYEGEAAVLGWFYDITERKLSEEKLKLFARVFAEAHEGIMITDASGNIIDVNPVFSEITGYSREEIIGQNTRILSSGRQPAEFYAAMWKALTDKGHWQGEIWNRKKDGEFYAELLTISALRDDHGKTLHYVGLFSDITHVKSQQESLELMAHYDPLTQLPNRVLFADRFQQAIARANRDHTLLAVCYLDLDGFKPVNDTLGHEAGDQLLIEVAERIKNALREEDTVSRLGGDEFALLMGNIRTYEECEQALTRIHQALAEPFMIDHTPVSIGASSGIAIYPQDDADPDTLLRHADQAMYKAKSAGRNRYLLFDSSYDQKMQNQHQHLREIEDAFSHNEFCLYYQPKVDMTTGRVLGAEALIRWNHPQRGLLPPGEFLPAVERTAFDIVLGNWVIDQALKQIESWNNQGLEIQISVNISPHHLQWPQFVAFLDATLALYAHIPSHQLQLEVLESSMVEDLAEISRTLHACRDSLGVSIALDDFGTGYSSLTYLRHLPANIVKIDQSFVRNMLDDPSDFAIVQGVIGLSDAFRRDIIAEGVETCEHGLMLLSIGCTLAQGYGIAHPMPAASMIDWVKRYQPEKEWEKFGLNPLTSRQAQALLLKLESAQWVRRMEACLNAAPETQPHWPILAIDKCHCGRWLLQAQKENRLDPEQLAEIAEAHVELHNQSLHLYQLYQADKLEEARAGIGGLHGCEQRIVRLLAALA